MRDNFFADTNVLLYSLDSLSKKQEIAFTIWRQGVTISTQVVMEFTNVCLKKFKFTKEEAFESAFNIMEGALVKSVTEKSVRLAFNISRKYGFSHWDSLIIAAALEAGCTILYSEDLHHGQVIEDKLTIINPFVSIR